MHFIHIFYTKYKQKHTWIKDNALNFPYNFICLYQIKNVVFVKHKHE